MRPLSLTSRTPFWTRRRYFASRVEFRTLRVRLASSPVDSHRCTAVGSVANWVCSTSASANRPDTSFFGSCTYLMLATASDGSAVPVDVGCRLPWPTARNDATAVRSTTGRDQAVEEVARIARSAVPTSTSCRSRGGTIRTKCPV